MDALRGPTRLLGRLSASRTSALLGPTNTGKTTRAIERMLRHPTGMFGLPLRLLAREVYDKVVAATSSDQVALVTGEEKIIPESPRYYICTVEAMPIDKRVAFVAVDEVQLAGNRQRGHVFTDRLLHVRGLAETVFMGSDTMEALLAELIPGIEIERAPRFSSLTMSGPHRLSSLPSRSAVVAFSAEKVYEIAERLKAVHGGTAVVLGALSPRTRNAQVELYQSGQVKYLVSTDAIGMGLNLDLKHVALAALRKYDGRTFRDLQAAELAQIAGRAGRYKNPGTFGALRPLVLPEELALEIESHVFPRVRRLFWRNRSLSFESVEALLTDLERAPSHRALVGVRGEDDQHVLTVLGSDPAVKALLAGPETIERLWEVCQVPDFRKTLTDAHVQLLRELALALLEDGRLEPEWVDKRIKRLDRIDGDIETLMSRIAWIRTWTYITFRRGWVDDPQHWQGRTRAIEDRLSDALHDALTARFVDRHAMIGFAGGPVRVEGERVWMGEHDVGKLSGFDHVPEGQVTRATMNKVRKGLKPVLEQHLLELEAAPDSELSVDDEHRIVWRDGHLATLQPGPNLLAPAVAIHRLELLDGRDKDRVRTRIQRWVLGTVDELLSPLRRGKSPGGALGGLLYELELGMGSVSRSMVTTQMEALVEQDKKNLAKWGVRLGQYSIFVPRTLRPDMVRVRARLYSVHHRHVPTLEAPAAGRTAVVADAPVFFYEAVGFPVVGGVAVRADVLEACAAVLRKLGRRGPFPLPEEVMSRLGVGREVAHGFVLGLGYKGSGERYRAPRR